jgi:ADP-dependent NAD(P)H-hydrate dehydratase / NAD(P)H-hydrate epimerase
MKIVTADQMREIDQESVRLGTPVSTLMENAGKAIAGETQKYLGAPEKQHILCLIGPGNNGGDGLVAARYLCDWGVNVTVYLCSNRPAEDANLKLVRGRGIKHVEAAKDSEYKKLDEELGKATCVIDGLLGTGKMRPLEGTFKSVLEKVNAAAKHLKYRVIAIDLPSGMDADTGAIDPACPAADMTVTLGFPKPGLFKFPGAERIGKLKIADIGIAPSLAEQIKLELLTKEWAATVIPGRPLSANKGTFGKLLVCAGSINYTGAAFLACAGAIRTGAGLVTLATAAALHPIIAAKLAEVTHLPLPEAKPGIISAGAAELVREQCGGYNALLLGCGLGQDPSTAEFVKSLTAKQGLPSMVIDADGLNILAKIPGWQQQLAGETILTPHPGEMSRLCGLSVEEIQADRTSTALKYAAAWQKTVVLKGAFTVIAAPDGRCRISPFANPGLASAGTGDVLAGTIAGLTAQGLSSFDAASLGVYLHGAAGGKVSKEIGDTGMAASDLLPALPLTIKQLKTGFERG